MIAILKMLLTILNDHRTINITSVILATIAGLYASYSGLLGRPSGFLRQLLVGIPLGIIGGIYSYLMDVNNTFSTLLRELIHFPAIPISSITIGIIGGISLLALPLTYPDFFRDEKERQGVSPPTVGTTILLFLFVATLNTFWNFVDILILFQLVNPWLHFHPPLLATLITAFFLAIIFSFSLIASLRPEPISINNMTLRRIAQGCIFGPYAVLAISVSVYLILALRWKLFVYIGIGAVAIAPLFLIQYGADHLSEKSLQILSLVLFVATAALQLYQAMVL